LDANITDQDMFYLEDRGIARRLLELSADKKNGTAAMAKVLSQEAFLKYKEQQALEQKKEAERLLRLERGEPEPHGRKPRCPKEEQRIAKLWENTNQEELLNPLQQAIWQRKTLMDSKQLTPILFLRTKKRNTEGEVSSYIDIAARLDKVGGWERFHATGCFRPLKSDLCYYDWEIKATTCSQESEHYVVIIDERGSGALSFQQKRDNAVVCVGVEEAVTADDSTTIANTPVQTMIILETCVDEKYLQATLYIPATHGEAS
jgi:hypothetical protein